MAEHARPNNVPKKFYRYFFKALDYYTDRLNRACTLSELQAYAYLKSNCMLTEKQLVPISQTIMKDLVASGIASCNGGFYRLNDLLRFSKHSPSARRTVQPSIPFNSHDDLHGGSGPSSSGRGVNFSNIVTMWQMDRELEITATLDASLPHGQLDVDAPQNPTEAAPVQSQNITIAKKTSEDKEKQTKSNETDLQTEEKKDTAEQSSSDFEPSHGDTDEALRVSTPSSDGEDEVVPIPHKPIKEEAPSDEDADAENQRSKQGST